MWRFVINRLLRCVCGASTVQHQLVQHSKDHDVLPGAKVQEAICPHMPRLPIKQPGQCSLTEGPYFSTPRSCTHQHVERCEPPGRVPEEAIMLLPGKKSHSCGDPFSSGWSSQLPDSCCRLLGAPDPISEGRHELQSNLLEDALMHLQLQSSMTHTHTTPYLLAKNTTRATSQPQQGLEKCPVPPSAHSELVTSSSSREISLPPHTEVHADFTKQGSSSKKHVTILTVPGEERERSVLQGRWQQQQNWLEQHGRANCALIYPEVMLQHAQRSRSLQMRFGKDPHQHNTDCDDKKLRVGHEVQVQKRKVYSKFASF